MTRTLVLLAALVATAPALYAQGVRDSVRVSYSVDSGYDVSPTGVSCYAYLHGEHPDFAGTLVGRGSYSYSGLPGNSDFFSFSASPPGLVVFEVFYGSAAGPNDNNGTCGALVAAAQAATGTVTWAIHTYPEGQPVAKFDTTASEGLTRGFDGSASFEAVAGRRVPVASYRWTFGDGSPDGTGVAPSHTYAQPGRYRVTLEVTDDDGQRDSYSRNVTVARPGLRVWAEAQTAGQEYRRDDDVVVVGYIENRSAEAVTDVRVPGDFTLSPIYPARVQPLPKQPPGYRRVRAGTNAPPARRDTTIASLGPGERAEIVQVFNVDRYAQYQPTPTSNFVATDATGYAILQGVTGRNALGQAVAVEQKCGFGPCGNTWEVRPTLQARLEFRTDNAYTTQARAGVVYNPAHDAFDLRPFNFSRVQPFQFAFVDGELERFCHTACADVRVVVTDSLTGEPIPNARVILRVESVSPLDASVTPEHSGGHLCVDGTFSTCGPTQTVTTDERGWAEAYYSFPGVVTPARGGVTAVVTEEGQNQVMAELRTPLQIVPNERTDFVQEVTLGQADVVWLSNMMLAVNGGMVVNGVAEVCESLIGGIVSGAAGAVVRPANSTLLHSGVNLLADWACGMNPYAIWANETAGAVKDASEVALISWFSTQFLPPDAGLGLLNGLYPPPVVFHWEGDYYDAVLDGLEAVANHAAPGTRLRLQLHEVSWQQPESSFNILMVPSVYFTLTSTTPQGTTQTHEALIELGYDAERWLGPPNIERLAAVAEANAERLRVAEEVERFRRGDFLTLDPGTPTAETVQVTGVSGDDGLASQGASGASARLATGPYEVTLSRRLRFAHPSGAEMLVHRDSLGVFPPRAPRRLSLDSVATARPVVLAWYVGLFETPETFDVQVARDTAFTTLLLDAPGLTATNVEAGTVQDGERLYWRVRAANRVGVGAWSPPGIIVGSDLATAGESGALPAALELGRPFPNPGRGAVTVPLSVPTAQRVSVEVVDALGRRVAVLHDGEMAAGTTVLRLDAASLAPGIYIVRAATSSGVASQRLTVVR